MSDTAAERLTVPKFMALKKAGRKITMLTAYDYTMAQLLDETGVDALLVGDSMSMVVQGHSTTLPVTLDEMIYHAEMVGRAVQRALTIPHDRNVKIRKRDDLFQPDVYDFPESLVKLSPAVSEISR